MAKFKFKLSLDTTLTEREEIVEIPDKELDGKFGFYRTDVIQRYFNRWLESYIESEWVEIKENSDDD